MALMGSFRNFATMLKSVATLGISNSVVKLVVENKKDERELSIIYSTFFWLFLGIASLLGISVLFFCEAISRLLFFTPAYRLPIQLFGILLPFMVINAFWLAIYNGLEKFRRIVYIQIISNILVFALTVFLIFKVNILGGLLSVALGEFLMVVATFLYVRKDQTFFRFDLQKILSKKYIDVIRKFSVMALLSAVIAPLTLILIRRMIVGTHTIEAAGIWDAINRLSGFYMLFFSSGLSMYYMPKLASLHTDAEFREELKTYFKTLVPLFLLMLVVIFIGKGIIVNLAFTSEFYAVKDLLIWQLAGDFLRIITLAFGFQILVKTMMKRYFLIEIVYNLSYYLISYLLVGKWGTLGALQAYFYANAICLVMALFMFRKLFLSRRQRV